MDILTQGLLGAALAQSVAKPNEARLATAVGFLSGLLADADALIRSSHDPLLTLEYHRHFTHSIFFVPIGGLIAALLLWPFFRHRLRFGRLYVFALLGYSLSGFLDACTSYGTHLLWPLSDTRIAWSIISIVDPVFTLTLLAAAAYALLKRTPRAAQVGLGLAGVYLLVGWVQLQRAETFARELAEARGHSIERLVVKPTLGNLVLWRSIYQNADTFHIDAVRVGMASERVYAGGRPVASCLTRSCRCRVQIVSGHRTLHRIFRWICCDSPGTHRRAGRRALFHETHEPDTSLGG